MKRCRIVSPIALLLKPAQKPTSTPGDMMSHLDFTLSKYKNIMVASQNAGYKTYSVSDWHALAGADRIGIMIRHDVDRRPENALAMARLENSLGIKSSYFFRILPCAFQPAIIREIAQLGHEIGYHYEDWHLAKRNPEKAIALFTQHLAQIREIAPVKAIAMHGSPLAKENNMTLWQHYSFADQGVIDAILSFDYSSYVFFTDSGRTFGASKANLRDYLGSAMTIEDVRTSDDLASWLLRYPHDRIQINVHPERWNEPGLAWVRQFAIDLAANAAKRAIKLVRSKS